jgi:hypothetical protein
MKRFKAHLLFIGILATSFCIAQIPKSDADKEGLRGKVYSVYTFKKCLLGNQDSCKLKNSSIKKMEYYDINGSLLLALNLNNDGTGYDTSEVINYFDDGRKEKRLYDPVDNNWKTVTCFFDSKGYLAEEIYSYPDSSKNTIFKITNIFNDEGLLVKTISHNKTINSNSIYTYKYNWKGEKIEETLGSRGKFQYEYDKTGNCIKNSFYNRDNICVLTVSSDFDEYNNQVKIVTYKMDGSVWGTQNFKYEYDSQKNWIKKIEISKDRPTIETVRVIEYY